MSDMVISVGDRVYSLVDHPDGNGNIEAGDTGVVCRISSPIVHIRWDKRVYGHSCGGLCDFGYGWNVNIRTISIVEDEGPDIEISD